MIFLCLLRRTFSRDCDGNGKLCQMIYLRKETIRDLLGRNLYAASKFTAAQLVISRSSLSGCSRIMPIPYCLPASHPSRTFRAQVLVIGNFAQRQYSDSPTDPLVALVYRFRERAARAGKQIIYLSDPSRFTLSHLRLILYARMRRCKGTACGECGEDGPCL